MCPPICRFADFFGEPALRTEKATQDRRACSGCCSGIRKNSDAASHAEAEFLRIPLPANFRALSRLTRYKLNHSHSVAVDDCDCAGIGNESKGPGGCDGRSL